MNTTRVQKEERDKARSLQKFNCQKKKILHDGYECTESFLAATV